ncbi:terpenoid synthase [Pyrrhoderma noxium]|uniref:Terpenoid synthase n=1 Tax=Pyrrhoderma noxium TaxID=2282107 RepID=A0A286UIK5_9AGAM|nr:terpenoid synthase [Pyrrhoderma noxium]
MDSPVEEIRLPYIMSKWPWSRQLNPYYEFVKPESEKWTHDLKAFNEKSQYAFDKCDLVRLAALTSPQASKELLRINADLMIVFFIIDEYTDVEPENVVKEMVDIIKDALTDPHKSRPGDETILVEMTRQFWELATKTASLSSQRHFLKSMHDYLDSVVQQAYDRDSSTVRTIDAYFEYRRNNVGTRPSFFALELELDLPDDVFYHHSILELSDCITDMVIVGNGAIIW